MCAPLNQTLGHQNFKNPLRIISPAAHLISPYFAGLFGYQRIFLQKKGLLWHFESKALQSVLIITL